MSTQQSDYSLYRKVKAQLRYFHDKSGIRKDRKELLEKPERVLSFILPIEGNSGEKIAVNGKAIRHGRGRGGFVCGIIYDSEITMDWVKSVALGKHLQASLARIPAEPLLVVIESQTLAKEVRPKIKDYLTKTILPHLGYYKNFELNPTNTSKVPQFSFLVDCFADLLEAIKDLEFPVKKRASIAASDCNPFTEEVFRTLPKESFEVLHFENVLSGASDLLILSGGNNLTASDARKVQSNVIIEWTEGAVTPESQTILAERHISVLPDILATMPKIVGPYLNQVAKNGTYSLAVDHVKRSAKRIIRNSIKDVWDRACSDSITLTTGAFVLAIQRSAQKCSSSHSFSG